MQIDMPRPLHTKIRSDFNDKIIISKMNFKDLKLLEFPSNMTIKEVLCYMQKNNFPLPATGTRTRVGKQITTINSIIMTSLKWYRELTPEDQVHCITLQKANTFILPTEGI